MRPVIVLSGPRSPSIVVHGIREIVDQALLCPARLVIAHRLASLWPHFRWMARIIHSRSAGA
jgi:hypothetical protein